MRICNCFLISYLRIPRDFSCMARESCPWSHLEDTILARLAHLHMAECRTSECIDVAEWSGNGVGPRVCLRDAEARGAESSLAGPERTGEVAVRRNRFHLYPVSFGHCIPIQHSVSPRCSWYRTSEFPGALLQLHWGAGAVPSCELTRQFLPFSA